MSNTTAELPSAPQSEDARLESLGYKPQLNRVLGFFANFAVAFTYLSPMVGIYSLFVLGVGTGGPAYVWLTWHPGGRNAPRRPRVRRAREPLPGGGRALPVQQVLRRPAVTAGSSAGSTGSPCSSPSRPSTPASSATSTALTHNWFGWNLEPGGPRDDPRHHGHPAGDPDDAQHHRRAGHGPRRAVRRVRRDHRHHRDRDHPRDPRLPPRAGLPLHDPERRARRDATRSASTSTGTGSPARR